MNAIYLDAAATTKPKKEVIETVKLYIESMWNNPSSLYGSATKVRDDIIKARKTVADYINAEENEIIFTSGASEANCLCIEGFISKCRCKGESYSVITSTIEHKSILLCVDALAQDVHYVGVNKEGLIKLDDLETILKSIPKDNKILVSIMFANNEIGTIQNVKDIVTIVHKYGGVFHTDATQAFGHENIDVKAVEIDMLSASAHKIGGLKGTGFLYKKEDIEINPIIYGTQENFLRGGTENVAGIMGLAKAVELAEKDTISQMKLKLARDIFILELEDIGCRLNGSLENRLANNINVTFPEGVSGESLIYLMDANGICISAGSACNSNSQEISHVLSAIGMSKDEALRTVRITLPDEITKEELEKAVSEFKKALKILGVKVGRIAE